MFEGKPPVPHGAPHQSTAAVDGAPLRELSWSDLNARLTAARELRQVLVRDAGVSSSFDAPCAAHVAALENGKEAVNPSDLANRKGAGPMNGCTPDAPATAQVTGIAQADGDRP